MALAFPANRPTWPAHLGRAARTSPVLRSMARRRRWGRSCCTSKRCSRAAASTIGKSSRTRTKGCTKCCGCGAARPRCCSTSTAALRRRRRPSCCRPMWCMASALPPKPTAACWRWAHVGCSRARRGRLERPFRSCLPPRACCTFGPRKLWRSGSMRCFGSSRTSFNGPPGRAVRRCWAGWRGRWCGAWHRPARNSAKPPRRARGHTSTKRFSRDFCCCWSSIFWSTGRCSATRSGWGCRCSAWTAWRAAPVAAAPSSWCTNGW